MAVPSPSPRPTDSDDSHYNLSNKSQKRKMDRACDACRRRKTKCDGPKMRDNVCTNCLQSRKSCTYVETSKPRGPPKAYVTGLEDRLEKMEELLKRRWPDTDFSDELGPAVVIGCWKADSSTPGPSSSCGGGAKRDDSQVKSTPLARRTEPLFSPSVPLGFSSHLMLSPPVSKSRRAQGKTRQSSGDDLEPICPDPGSDVDVLVEDFEGKTLLSLRTTDANPAEESNHNRFHGASCSLGLLDVARKYKHLHTLDNGSNDGNSPAPSLGPHSLRRPECWQAPKWELQYEGLHMSSPEILPQVLSRFPPPDLCDTLIRLYFQHVNSQFPLLHRPTFERQWQQSLHERNAWFACLVMTLFSVASRWCDDLRVLPKSTTKQENGDIDWTRAGWDYFEVAVGIHRHRRSLIYPATLFEIQGFSLMAMFLRGTNSHALSWHLTSIGIRKAQDVGAHRRTVYHAKPNVVEELWKRAFWLLLGFDRIGSATLGRTCNVGEEDYDIDLPLEVDDEYWEAEEPSRAFRQPPGVPSRITAFNLWLKLTQIVAFTMRTVYATNPAKVIMGRPIGKPEQIVSQINAALTEWVDSVPDAFKWSGQGQDDLSSNLSATLYTTYYLTQMLIYRPFIPAPMSNNSTFPFPALSICTNAARSSARIIEEQLQRGLWNVPNLNAVSIVSASMLLVHVWDLKHKDRTERENGMDIDPPISCTVDPLLKDINIFIRALEWSSHRYEVVKPVL
ncbi:fungal-specific transcription factor domain-containing protein [Mucidula mucida]|nr:fungal-specific transcription factor domain-containing protein [Mucidula mucida]